MYKGYLTPQTATFLLSQLNDKAKKQLAAVKDKYHKRSLFLWYVFNANSDNVYNYKLIIDTGLLKEEISNWFNWYMINCIRHMVKQRK